MNIWFYDIEVFAHDWIAVFKCKNDDHHEIIHNDPFRVAQLLDIKKPLLCGYNNKHYDQWILRAIYHNAEPENVKALNDFIIKEGRNDPWNFPGLDSHLSHPCKQFDLMDDLGGVFLRLKEAEGNLGMDIEETEVDFDLNRALTQQELELTIKYCCHDVDATERLFEKRKKYLESKVVVGGMKNIPPEDALNLTNAKLTALYLCGQNARPQPCEDEFEYEFPENLLIDKYPEVVEFFAEIDPTYQRTLNISIAGTPHIIAWGGIHGAIEHYSEESTDQRKIMHIDVTSYYPSLMIVNHLLSRAAQDPEEYKNVYDQRVAAKKAGDKSTANALKLILNTTYGAMKNKYNPLYDPHQANAVCISGQLYLVDLIEKLENIPSFKLIQSNTDGLIVSCNVDYIPKITHQVKRWEDRTGFSMGIDVIKKIVQKDVNNYVLLGAHDEIEVKGGYVSDYEGGSFKHKSLVIVAKAVVENLLHSVPPLQTINDCTNPEDFQIIAKAGSTYDKVIWKRSGKDVTVQNVNRIYASTDKKDGTLYKIKLEKEGQKARSDKIANLPDHCYIDNTGTTSLEMIDKNFYVDFAQKRINDYLGIKPEKKERKKRMTKKAAETTMPEKDVSETIPITLPKKEEVIISGLGAKLMKLREVMNSFSWEKDGINRHQSYTYFSEKLYKSNFKKALDAANLDFKATMLDYQFIPAISDKMNMIIARFQFEIIDRETGEKESYIAGGSGSDTLDKGLYKAYTGAIKYFLANNFLVAEGNDPESDEGEVQQDKPKYTPPERREEIKEKIESNDGPATEVQIETIANGIAMLEEAKKPEADDYAALLETDLTAADAQTIIEAINTILGDDAA
ncbi:conserved protein of unknown function [Ruminococcaceae bacterium BL-4]|nr:conserved protein of unknown function [Ruminococcaceae bacterium BL-4]